MKQRPLFMFIILTYHKWRLLSAQATREEKIFSSFSEPKRKITGEILLESPKPSPVINDSPEVHPNS